MKLISATSLRMRKMENYACVKFNNWRVRMQCTINKRSELKIEQVYSLMERASKAARASWALPLVCLSSRMASSRENPRAVICCMAPSGNVWAWFGGGGCEVGEEWGTGCEEVEGRESTAAQHSKHSSIIGTHLSSNHTISKSFWISNSVHAHFKHSNQTYMHTLFEIARSLQTAVGEIRS